ncbi:transposase [Paenibacillus antri]|uniref:Transposase n=1 Tax=Paenibacillus antri TaxID=2582848 RepID=A0A5R9G3T1_9BACL|nr:transposase [Paenibacillus antri]TLS48800.1 transposase [Paenibacillus antri]
MYKPYGKIANQILLPGDFFLPFGGKLNPDNRWCKLAQLIPWAKVDQKYAKSLKKSMRGQQAVSIRTALGSLIIQERLQLSDRETLEQLTENPYLQYFIGLEAYQDRKPPFHHSLMTHFRKRLNAEVLQEINEMIAIESAKQEQDRDDDDSMPGAGKSAKPKQSIRPEADPNQGTLLLDATCAPADIAYPTGITLLHTGREKLEEIIDALHAPHKGTLAKPRTYREKARKAYLAVAKQRRIGHKKLRKAIGKQLKFIARDIFESLSS